MDTADEWVDFLTIHAAILARRTMAFATGLGRPQPRTHK
jgi:hypothetical protein